MRYLSAFAANADLIAVSVPALEGIGDGVNLLVQLQSVDKLL